MDVCLILKLWMSILANEIYLSYMRVCMEKKGELCRSIAHDVAPITQHATADVYTPHNISLRSKQSINL